MSEVRAIRERHLWIALVAVLATSMAWLAAVNLVLILHAWSGSFPVTVRVVRVLLRVAVSMIGQSGPLIPAGLAVWPTVALLLATPGPRRHESGATHA
jgi:hypothetical protein